MRRTERRAWERYGNRRGREQTAVNKRSVVESHLSLQPSAATGKKERRTQPPDQLHVFPSLPRMNSVKRMGTEAAAICCLRRRRKGRCPRCSCRRATCPCPQTPETARTNRRCSPCPVAWVDRGIPDQEP